MTTELLILSAILGCTILVLALDLLRMDLAALLCLLALSWSGILSPAEALAGFSSTAVLSMVAIMVLGRGIAGTGLMERFARRVLAVAGQAPSALVATVSGAVGLLSGFIQNVGAAALFLPALISIARHRNLPVSALIMPVGFSAILGGTLTMIGSGPLIMTNDLLAKAGHSPYGLFAVTPLGICLLLAGILLFLFAGRLLLPRTGSALPVSPLHQLQKIWQLPLAVRRCTIPAGSPLIGRTPEQSGIWSRYQLNILSLLEHGMLSYAPWRETVFAAGQELVLLGEEQQIQQFVEDHALDQANGQPGREELHDHELAGFAEVLITPRSGLVGETLHGFGLRRRYGLEPVMLLHHGRKVRGDLTEEPIEAGDLFILYGPWESLRDLQSAHNLLTLTPLPPPTPRDRPGVWPAAACFLLAVGMPMIGAPLVTSLLTGAVALVVTGVMRLDEAYQAVDWRVTVFLAGLLPLGTAMQKTGLAALLSSQTLTLLHGSHPVLLLSALALLASLLSLVMSNMAATVLLAPLALALGKATGVDPRPLVLLVAVCSSNAFLLPTHQVNALLKGPGGYRNRDYLKAGGAMSILFLAVVIPLMYLFYL